MTDLEMTKLCAEAMGLALLPAYPYGDIRYRADASYDGLMYSRDENCFFTHRGAYDPLHDDAQAMELLRRSRLEIYVLDDGEWGAVKPGYDQTADTNSKDLNRAIVECVAKMQAARS